MVAQVEKVLEAAIARGIEQLHATVESTMARVDQNLVGWQNKKKTRLEPREGVKTRARTGMCRVPVVEEEFQLGDKVALVSSTKLDVIAIGVVTGIGGQQGVHHCTQVYTRWYRVQLVEIMEGFGKTPLLITNDNDDPPQLQLKDTMGSSLVWKGQFMHKGNQ
ncbi:unnamed protein product [Sphagnum tenellum]